MKYLISCFLISSVALGATDLKKWKEKEKAYDQDAAVLTATGKGKAAKLKAESAALQYPRMEALAKKKVITEMKARESKRDKILAEVAALQFQEEAIVAGLRKTVIPFEKECDAGKQQACDAAASIYEGIFRSREMLAVLAVRKLRAELELETFQFESICKLIDADAIDGAIREEERLKLEAKKAELKAAEDLAALAHATMSE